VTERGNGAGRRTLAGRSETVAGTGLHTGAATQVTFAPAAPGAGVSFTRTDLPGRPVIPARLASVTGVDRRTVLANGAAEVHTVEHVLAAVAALELDDLVIEITGPEPPILDGSSRAFLAALTAAGIAAQAGEPDVLVVGQAFTVKDGDSEYVVAPGERLSLTTTIEFAHPLIGRQSAAWDITPEVFGRELAAARTFGFLRDGDALRARGLIAGVTTQSAIVLDETGVVDTALHWPDEFVRHKLSDLLGDLALLGGRLRARVVATRPSHRGNVALGRAIRARATRPSGGAVHMDIRQILDVIPHRYPMLLVDRILEVEEKKRIVGIKNVTFNEPFFQGHFPGHPVMPGVLIIEAMAQVGGMLLMSFVPREDHERKVVYFMSLDAVKFRRPVTPGDQLRCELEMLQFRGKTCKMKGVALVDGNVVCEAEMMAALVDK
jgi:UDP-3-O-[3-hydroxymyristoyl] N-acetylglucosamine deacetylase / 3-hydroxyacyl-[acyl-carrier-protein] dehydratase